MKLRKTTTGERFDLDKTKVLSTINYSQNDDSRGENLQVTATGKFIIEKWSRHQGEETEYIIKTKEEAFELLLLEDELTEDYKESYFKKLSEDDFVDI